MVNKALVHVLEGLFPAHCILCGLRSHRPLPLCDACERELQANPSCCYRCAIPLPAGSATGTVCGQCLQAPPPFQRAIAPWLYCERLAYLIRRWKFQGERRLTPLLAWLWLRQLDQGPAGDALVLRGGSDPSRLRSVLSRAERRIVAGRGHGHIPAAGALVAGDETLPGPGGLARHHLGQRGRRAPCGHGTRGSLRE